MNPPIRHCLMTVVIIFAYYAGIGNWGIWSALTASVAVAVLCYWPDRTPNP